LRRELALRRAAVARPHRVADRARAAAERPGWPAGANGAPASPPADDPDATNRLPEATETVAVSTEATAEVSEQGGEGFRVLTPRAPRPRHRAEDEPQPGALPPGAAATGARSFEPAMGSSSSTRMLAGVALELDLERLRAQVVPVLDGVLHRLVGRHRHRGDLVGVGVVLGQPPAQRGPQAGEALVLAGERERQPVAEDGRRVGHDERHVVR